MPGHFAALVLTWEHRGALVKFLPLIVWAMVYLVVFAFAGPSVESEMPTRAEIVSSFEYETPTATQLIACFPGEIFEPLVYVSLTTFSEDRRPLLRFSTARLPGGDDVAETSVYFVGEDCKPFAARDPDRHPVYAFFFLNKVPAERWDDPSCRNVRIKTDVYANKGDAEPAFFGLSANVFRMCGPVEATE